MQETYSRTVQIIEPIDSSNASSLITIYEPGHVSPYDRAQSLKFYGFITDLRAMVDINSLPEVTIPELELGTSRTTKSELIRDLEYGSPRYEMQLLISNTAHGWMPLFNFSLLNRQPFYIVDLMAYMTTQPAFAVANDSMLGVRVLDVGYGLPDGDDRINIYGAVREEVTSLPSDGDIVTQETAWSTTIGTTSTVIVPVNPSRKGLVVVNQSPTSKVTLSYQAVANLNEGIVLYPTGGSYEINNLNRYQGFVSAIAEEPNTTISIAEFT